MKWKKAKKRKNAADPMLKVPIIHVCAKCRNRVVDQDGDLCPRCAIHAKAFKQEIKNLDEEYRLALLKHKL